MIGPLNKNVKRKRRRRRRKKRKRKKNKKKKKRNGPYYRKSVYNGMPFLFF